MGTPAHTPPNVLLIVMDCVRADEFPPYPHGGPGLPTFERLRSESVAFPNAAAPSSWTLPSHASLFTGMYPWEHGLHGKGDHRLDPSIPTIAETLERQGYRTLCISANSHISPSSGLTRGFGQAWRGEPIDLYWRFGGSRPATSEPARLSSGIADGSRIPGDSPHGELTRTLLSRVLESPPLLWDAVNRVGEAFSGRKARDPGTVSPWMEQAFDNSVRKEPSENPVFAFINFVDAHEPYPIASCHGNPIDWVRKGLVPQSRRNWGKGNWRPTPFEYATLRELYRHAIARLDRRVGRIISTLEKTGRWDNTLLILTSDHGQAFGEGGALYHEFSLDESVSRVPLWVRFPNRRFAGVEAQGWASLVDVVPTIAAQVGNPPGGPTSGRDLTTLLDSDRPEAVYSSAEGFLWNNWPQLSASRRSELDRVRVAAYLRSTRFELDAEVGVLEERPCNHNGGVAPPPWPVSSAQRAEVGRYVAQAADRIRHARSQPPPDSVAERMKAWGY